MQSVFDACWNDMKWIASGARNLNWRVHVTRWTVLTRAFSSESEEGEGRERECERVDRARKTRAYRSTARHFSMVTAVISQIHRKQQQTMRFHLNTHIFVLGP